MLILDLIAPFGKLLRSLGQNRTRRQEAEQWVEHLLLVASLKENSCVGIRPDPTRKTILVTLYEESSRGSCIRRDADISTLDAACLMHVERAFRDRIQKSQKAIQRISKRNPLAFRSGFLETIPGTQTRWEISIITLSGMQTFFLRRV